MNFKKIESDIIAIYESETKDKLINARELHSALRSKRQFADWIKQRIKKYEFVENEDFITFHNFVKREGNLGSKIIEYYLTIDTAKEICMIDNNLPHSNFVGAIARKLGYKISYKHYYEDEYIAVVPDISKGNNYYQVYYKPKSVEEIIKWFNENKYNIEYKIIYERNTKNGAKGEIREKGYKIEKVCYKIKNR